MKNTENVKMNMLRERANKLPEVTNKMYSECNEHNREMISEFFEIHPLLSPATKRQYKSATRQFLYWVHTSLNGKPLYKITKRDFNRYLSYLINRGMSSSGVKFKKSSVSTVCEYLETIVAEDDEKYETFHNFTKTGMKIPTNHVYNKIPISEEEYKLLIDTLMEDENYMGCAWVACAFNTGARRGGIRQFKTEIIDKPIKEGQSFVMSNTVREKGASIDGKPVEYMIPIPALYYIKLWCEKRGYDHEYIFTVKYGGEYKPISLDWANKFCGDVLSDILGRRINPHLFKSSAVCYYLSHGADLKFVSKNIAKHNDISTTSNFYDLRTFEDEKNEVFANLPSINTKTVD
ncbi:tyrosine-type recombinase/integrase [Clostridium botulinum]|uniref:tyrosine-type recombinase/integrase n=1 Tax=Clostridium botulinum TaxID=1491 RepID=UPI001E5F6833|nr:site-specific integrase [Clostridium botulinum]